METSLHRELKYYYATRDAQFEAVLGDYRIDVRTRRRLVEIQHGALAAIRDKVRRLLKEHKVVVVKPIIVTKQLVKLSKKGGEVVSRRRSPKRGQAIDVFHDLIHFMKVFPHPNLTIDIPLVDVEEWRYPGHGKRRRRRENDFQIADQKLVAVHKAYRMRTANDMARLVDCELPATFDTADLATGLGIPRWIAQRIAYCLRESGVASEVGRRGNSRLYKFRRRPSKQLPTVQLKRSEHFDADAA